MTGLPPAIGASARSRLLGARSPRPWLVAGLALGLTALAWQFATAITAAEARHEFDERTAGIERAVRDRLRVYENVLYGARAMHDARGGLPDRVEWRRYVAGLELDDRYPGLLGIGYSVKLAPESLDAHIADVRNQGFPDYRVAPEGARSEYHAIVYLEPFSGRNLRAFGYDMSTDPVRRAAMARARDTGAMAISGKVTLVQESGPRSQAGFLMYLPVYRPGAPVGTVEQRREALVGYTYSPFRMDDLMQGILGRDADGPVSFAIYDGSDADESALMHRSAADAGRPRLASARTVEIVGRPWHMAFSSRRQFDDRFGSSVPGIVLGGGLALSILAGALAHAAARRRRERERVEREKLATEKGFRYLFANNPLPMWLYDAESFRFLEVNDAAIARYGFTRAEFMAMTILELRPPEEVERLRSYVGSVNGELQKSGPWIHRLRDGALIDVEVHAYRLGWNGVPAVLVVANDVTERRRAEAQLQAMNEHLEARVAERTAELEAANRELEAFSYSVSHDLRAPIATMANFAEILRDTHGAALGDDGCRMLDRIMHAGSRMERLIHGLLALAQLKNKPLERQAVDLSAIADGIARELAQRHHDRRVEVRIHPSLRAQADPVLIRAVLANLLGNAWKFTRREAAARIEVGAAPEAGAGVYFVRDNGAGFPPEQADKLFKPFQRLHRESDFEGTGIGLSTVSRIIGRHGGRIWAESRPGAGACFWFTLA